MKQHMNALVYFAEEPELLPPGPSVSAALPEFRSAARRVIEALRTAAESSHGALDMHLPGLQASVSLEASLGEFFAKLDDNLLPMSVTFFEDGNLSLYSRALQEKVLTSMEATCKS